jgi:hypothetical protein
MMVALLIGAGCQTVAKIEYPSAGASAEPVTNFRVRFHKDYKPGTFKATLNGQDITGNFNPAGAPGAVATANSDFMDARVNNNVQVLHAQGEFTSSPGGIPTRSTHDEVQFSPPIIFVFRGNTTNHTLDVHERETITATVTVLAPPKEGLTVTVTTDENSAVSLNNAPAGTPITVTIPTNDRRADFTIRGIQTGKTFLVRALAHGYAFSPGGGTVLYP